MIELAVPVPVNIISYKTIEEYDAPFENESTSLQEQKIGNYILPSRFRQTVSILKVSGFWGEYRQVGGDAKS